MKALTLFVLLASAITLGAQTAPVGIVPPGATSSAPIAVGGFLSYDAQPAVGAKHTTGGGFLLYPAANTATGHPTYARLSIDVAPATNCKGCLGTSFRFGAEQVLFASGQFVTTAGADVGVVVQSTNTVGALSFNIREAYRFKDKSKFINGIFVSAGGQQNGNSGVLSKFEAGVFKSFGSN